MNTVSLVQTVPAHITYYSLTILALQVGLIAYIFWRAMDSADARLFGSPRVAKATMVGSLLAVALGVVFLDLRGAYVHKVGTVPLLVFGLGVPVTLGVAMLMSASFRRVLGHVDLSLLMGMQFFRAFGLIFPLLYDLGLLPQLFAFAAGYGDIFVGVTAPAVVYLYGSGYRYRLQVALVWNVIGIVDILPGAVATFLLSLPGVLSTAAVGPSSQLMSEFPLVLIPTFIAPVFVVLHFYAIKALWTRRASMARPICSEAGA